MPAGPQFSEKRTDCSFHFNTKSGEHNYHLTPTHETNTTKYIQENDTYLPIKIINTPVDPNTEKYIVQVISNRNIIEVNHKDLLNNNPNSSPDPTTDN